jgi:phosphate transport system substrate-binding protein
MEQIVMKDSIIITPPATMIVTGMGELIESVAKYDNSKKALGYSVYYYAKSMYNRDTIKLIGVDGVFPDNKSISSGKYPFTSAYYAVIRKSEKPNSPQRKLITWILSREGQKIAETAGYVPMGVE